MTGEDGTIYVLHFDRPLHHARHYVGWAHFGGTRARLERHRRGCGARLMRAVMKEEIGFRVANLIPGTRTDERRLKDRHQTSSFCAICRSEN